VRISQKRFLTSINEFENCYRIKGVDDERFQIKSHIKPWIDCCNYERIDGNNDLLSSHVDKMFDNEYISFAYSHNLYVESKQIFDILTKWVDGSSL
jgi:putative restriction endonuclease